MTRLGSRPRAAGGQVIEEPTDDGNGIYCAPCQETGYPPPKRVLWLEGRIREPDNHEQEKQTERTENALGIQGKQMLRHHNPRRCP